MSKWWDKSWNTLIGCSHASVGCLNCYAEKLAGTRLRHLETYGAVVEGDTGRWNARVLQLRSKLDQPTHWRKPRRIFVNDMSDTFHPEVPFEYIAAIYGVMAACPQHTFILLTKRVERMLEFYQWVMKREEHGRSMFDDDSPEWRIWQMLHVSARRHGVNLPPHHGGVWPLPNVWTGTTCENQAMADKRIPVLVQVPSAVRLVSAEPLLETIDFERVRWPFKHIEHRVDVLRGGFWNEDGSWPPGFVNHSDFPATLDWIICGGESGPKARQCDRKWLESIVQQCERAGKAVFVKQLGSAYVDAENAVGGRYVKVPSEYGSKVRRLKDVAGRDMAEWPESLRVRQYPEARCAT